MDLNAYLRVVHLECIAGPLSVSLSIPCLPLLQTASEHDDLLDDCTKMLQRHGCHAVAKNSVFDVLYSFVLHAKTLPEATYCRLLDVIGSSFDGLLASLNNTTVGRSSPAHKAVCPWMVGQRKSGKDGR